MQVCEITLKTQVPVRDEEDGIKVRQMTEVMFRMAVAETFLRRASPLTYYVDRYAVSFVAGMATAVCIISLVSK